MKSHQKFERRNERFTGKNRDDAPDKVKGWVSLLCPTINHIISQKDGPVASTLRYQAWEENNSILLSGNVYCSINPAQRHTTREHILEEFGETLEMLCEKYDLKYNWVVTPSKYSAVGMYDIKLTRRKTFIRNTDQLSVLLKLDR